MQQLTCNIDLSCSFYYFFFSFVLIELKPFVVKGKSWGKKCGKVWKILKRFCPLVVALEFFSLIKQGKKEYTPPPWDPSFLGLSPDPEVTEQKTLW